MKKEVKIGITGVVALFLFYLGMNFLKGVSIFRNTDTYYITFSNAKGLSKSSKVYADGYDIGIVSDIIYGYDKPGNVIVEISTNRALRIPKGSTARLDEAILGGCTLQLLLANNPVEAFHSGDTIKGIETNGMMANAENLIPKVDSILLKVDTLLAALNKVASNPAIPAILDETHATISNLNASSAELKNLMQTDIPHITTTFGQVSENVDELTAKLSRFELQPTIDSVNATISGVRQMVDQMQSPEGSLGLLMKDPELYHSLNNTVQSADSLLTDIKARPKRYVHFSVFGKKDKK